MNKECRLQLLGIRQLSVERVKSLLQLGCLETAETIQCPCCCERYHLVIDAGKTDPATIGVINLADPIKNLFEQVAAEHGSGHCSELLVVGFDAAESAAKNLAQLNSSCICGEMNAFLPAGRRICCAITGSARIAGNAAFAWCK